MAFFASFILICTFCDKPRVRVMMGEGFEIRNYPTARWCVSLALIFFERSLRNEDVSSSTTLFSGFFSAAIHFSAGDLIRSSTALSASFLPILAYTHSRNFSFSSLRSAMACSSWSVIDFFRRRLCLACSRFRSLIVHIKGAHWIRSMLWKGVYSLSLVLTTYLRLNRGPLSSETSSAPKERLLGFICEN